MASHSLMITLTSAAQRNPAATTYSTTEDHMIDFLNIQSLPGIRQLEISIFLQTDPLPISAQCRLPRGVSLAESVAAIRDRVPAIASDRSMDPMSLVPWPLFEIGDHVPRGVVCRIAVQEREVCLPYVLNAGRLRHSQVGVPFIRSGLHAGNRDWLHAVVTRAQALSRSIVDDDHLRPDRAKQRRRSRVVESAMPVDCIEGDRAELVDRTRELELSLPVEIAEAGELEIAVGE